MIWRKIAAIVFEHLYNILDGIFRIAQERITEFINACILMIKQRVGFDGTIKHLFLFS